MIAKDGELKLKRRERAEDQENLVVKGGLLKEKMKIYRIFQLIAVKRIGSFKTKFGPMYEKGNRTFPV